jgi:hypothetical protein
MLRVVGALQIFWLERVTKGLRILRDGMALPQGGIVVAGFATGWRSMIARL